MKQLPDFEKYVDDDGYPCFGQHEGLPGPGLWWTKHLVGWQCYIDDPNVTEPIYTAGDSFPDEDDIEAAADLYRSIFNAFENWRKETALEVVDEPEEEDDENPYLKFTEIEWLDENDPCPECGSTDTTKNNSGQIRCDNCGYDEGDEEDDENIDLVAL